MLCAPRGPAPAPKRVSQFKTVDVKTKKKFPNDPKVDEICRDTIKKWRFKPFIVGGKPVKTCSVAEFNLKFT